MPRHSTRRGGTGPQRRGAMSSSGAWEALAAAPPPWLGELAELVLVLAPALIALAAVASESKSFAVGAQLGELETRVLAALPSKHRERAETAIGKARSKAEDLKKAVSSRVRVPRAETRLRVADKLTFTMGCANMAVTPYIWGAFPELFIPLHTIKVTFMVAVRWVVFKTRKEHYYLFDFCYCMNAMLLFFLWARPDDESLFRACFVLANGPLAWSILAFNCAMVFHSLQHITSLHIHLSPMLVTYIIRWQTPPGYAKVVQDTDVSKWQMLGGALVFYAAWMILYYAYIFVLASDRIKSRGYQTLYTFVVESTPAGRLLKLCPESVRPIAYMLMHFSFGMATASCTLLLWNSRLGHFAFIATMSVASAWNASGYYFDYFAARYEGKLKHRAEHVRARNVAKSD